MSEILRNDQEYQKEIVTREEALCNVNDKIGHQTMDANCGDVEESRSYKGPKKLVLYHRIIFRLTFDRRTVLGLTFDHQARLTSDPRTVFRLVFDPRTVFRLVFDHQIVFRLVFDHRVVFRLTFDHWIVLVLLTGPLNEV